MIEKQKSDDGGPAFPVVESHPVHGSRIDFGMTLRDYFASQALSGLLAMYGKDELDGVAIEQIANDAYDIAFHMLKARNQ